jgi:hypothetical protein
MTTVQAVSHPRISNIYHPHGPLVDIPSSPVEIDYILDSPIDPFGTVSSTSRHDTQGTEFFNAVYFDARLGDISPGLKGSTAPLRIRKRCDQELQNDKYRRIKTGGKRIVIHYCELTHVMIGTRQRHSASSLPHSLRSISSRRTTGSIVSLHPHQLISTIFLSSPSSPIIMSPYPLQSRVHPSTTISRSSSLSELHLGLGIFGVYDNAAVPGPSPPMSPALSPIKRRFQAVEPESPEKNIRELPLPHH